MKGMLGDLSGVCLSRSKTNASQASRSDQGEKERERESQE